MREFVRHDKTGIVIPSNELRPCALIVEGDQMIRKALYESFEMGGLSSVACDTLKKARAIMRDIVPRMVILDWKLQDGSGINFCRELRDGGYTFPILIYSVHSDSASIRAGYDAGCTDYVVKPSELNILLLKSKNYLELCEVGTPYDRDATTI
jgi:DNA-binding response OmpR family regulator